MTEYLVITDTSCLILFEKLKAFDLLHAIYPEVVTTTEIASEFGEDLPDWLMIIPVRKRELITKFINEVDRGEASAIALAHEVDNALLILDDGKARKLADRLGLTYIGTIGIFIKARQQDKIESLRPYFEQIKQTDFRIAPAILDRILLDFGD